MGLGPRGRRQGTRAGGLGPGWEGGGGLWPRRLGAAHAAGGAPGPFTLQGLLGCELGPDNVSVPVATFALNGEEFMKFDTKLGTWDGEWPEARTIGSKWMQEPDAVNKEKTFLLYSCPHRLLGHLERGRGNLEWKGEQPPEGPARPLLPDPLAFSLPPPPGAASQGVFLHAQLPLSLALRPHAA